MDFHPQMSSLVLQTNKTFNFPTKAHLCPSLCQFPFLMPHLLIFSRMGRREEKKSESKKKKTQRAQYIDSEFGGMSYMKDKRVFCVIALCIHLTCVKLEKA